jgi:sugar phosphate isomerase/epimerase
MEIGFYTYSYIDRLGMEIEPVLETVAAAGYRSIDVSATWRDDLDPALMPDSARARYVKAASRLQLRIEACVTHLGLVQAVWDNLPLNLRGAVDVAIDLGARIVTVHIGQSGGRFGDAWRTAVKALQSACEYGEQKDVVIALDAVWPDTILDTPERVVQMIRDVGSTHLKHNYDPCYLVVSGQNLVRATSILAPYIVHAHIKDHVGCYPKFQHRIAGEGSLEHGRYMSLLRDHAFIGVLAHECFNDMPLKRACLVGYDTLATALRDCLSAGVDPP